MKAVADLSALYYNVIFQAHPFIWVRRVILTFEKNYAKLNKYQHGYNMTERK